MTDPPTPEELAAATTVWGTGFHFQIAALRFANASEDKRVEAARDYVKRMRAHQKAVEEAHEAFKEPPADG